MRKWSIFAGRLAAALVWVAGVASAQNTDLTIYVDGPLLGYGGVVEMTGLALSGATSTQQAITLTDRYAQIQIRYPEGASFTYRFQPVSEAMALNGMDLFVTETLTIGTRTVNAPDGPQEAAWRSVRVFPFAEYGGLDSATRTIAAWGETEAYADPPPANHWGARALPGVFETFGDGRTVGLICSVDGAVSVCTPDPDDALLIEALWWRSIAEGRLERLRHDALRDCYDEGGLFGRPERCEADPESGWPKYRPAD